MSKPQRHRMFWTDDEITYLLDHYYEMSNAELAKKLGRTKQAIIEAYQKFRPDNERRNKRNIYENDRYCEVKERVKMKVNVDYLAIHEAIEKLENGDTLNDKEKQDVLAVLRAVQGDYIPTKEELERQERNIRLLDLYNPESDGFNRIYEQVLEFESKYC